MTDPEPTRTDAPATSPEPEASASTAPAATLVYESVLKVTIAQAQRDPAHLRSLIYELARMKLKRETIQAFPQLKRDDAKRQLAELETAIAAVEAAQARAIEAPVPTASAPVEQPAPAEQPAAPASPAASEPHAETPVVVVSERPAPPSGDDFPMSPVLAHENRPAPPAPTRAAPLKTMLQIAAAAVVGIALFAVLSGQISLSRIPFTSGPAPSQIADPTAEPTATDTPSTSGDATPSSTVPPSMNSATPAAPVSQPPDMPFPMPASYGVYAVSDGRLHQLQALSVNVSDVQVPFSPAFDAASQTTLPGDNLAFVIYRRELALGLPSQMQLRVVGQVTREIVFSGGAALTKPIAGPWHVRAMAVEFPVTPVPSNRDLATVQPKSGFLLSPGRYALVIDGLGYDFQVPGSPVSVAHCLERFDGVAGPVVAQCKTP